MLGELLCAIDEDYVTEWMWFVVCNDGELSYVIMLICCMLQLSAAAQTAPQFA